MKKNYFNKIYRSLVGYRSRYTYWSNSALSKTIQQHAGMKKTPTFATPKEWRELAECNKQISPIIFWITEEGFDLIQDVVYFPSDVYRNIRQYIVNRFIDKTHIIDTKLEKGQWHEVDEILLHGIMETVVKFVECQKAHMQDISFNIKDQPKIKDRREAGLKYLDWEISLGDESPKQSETATIVKEVYLWWNDQRPNRPDIHDVTGWSDYCAVSRPNVFEHEDNDRQKVREMLDDIQFLEEFYDNEDYRMVEKIFKCRHGMWT